MKSSYFISQSELVMLLTALGVAEDVVLYQGRVDPSLAMRWFQDGRPRAAIYFASKHFVPIFNLNVENMMEILGSLQIEQTKQSTGLAGQKMLPNAYCAENLAQGDCGPDSVRMIVKVLRALDKVADSRAGGEEKSEAEDKEAHSRPEGEEKSEAEKQTEEEKKAAEDKEAFSRPEGPWGKPWGRRSARRRSRQRRRRKRKKEKQRRPTAGQRKR